MQQKPFICSKRIQVIRIHIQKLALTKTVRYVIMLLLYYDKAVNCRKRDAEKGGNFS